MANILRYQSYFLSVELKRDIWKRNIFIYNIFKKIFYHCHKKKKKALFIFERKIETGIISLEIVTNYQETKSIK